MTDSATTTRLHRLRRQLHRLRRRRQIQHLGIAATSFLTAVAMLLAIVFTADWALDMDTRQRAVLLVAGAAAAVWAFSRFARPWLRQGETLLETALLVEKLHGIDSDLVAAIQFESPAAARWGSPELKSAVVGRAVDHDTRMNLLQGFSRAQFIRRGIAFTLVAAALAVAVYLFPHHGAAFLNRLLLGGAHYPTNTLIEQITINGQSVYPLADDRPPLWVAYGRALRFQVSASGELPSSGRAELMAIDGSASSTVALVVTEKTRCVYSGQSTRLVEPVRFQVFLGDAWTDSVEVNVIPLPVVQITLEAFPPDYTARVEDTTGIESGVHNISVVEGSRVGLELLSMNKRLKSTTISIGGKQYPLVAVERDRHKWKLPWAGTPLDHLTESTGYELQVVDQDDLSLEEPVRGFLRIKADRRPRVSAAVVTNVVLPGATPTVIYGATDDYGIARLQLRRQVVRQLSTEPVEDAVDIPHAGLPSRTATGRYTLDLEPMGLAKGDQIKVTLEAVDYRGSASGVTVVSEPLVLIVTDRAGVLEAMLEADRRSVRELDAIIERQLGLGETP